MVVGVGVGLGVGVGVGRGVGLGVGVGMGLGRLELENFICPVPAAVKSVSVRVICLLWPGHRVTVGPPCNFKVAAFEGEMDVVAVMTMGSVPTFFSVYTSQYRVTLLVAPKFKVTTWPVCRVPFTDRLNAGCFDELLLRHAKTELEGTRFVLAKKAIKKDAAIAGNMIFLISPAFLSSRLVLNIFPRNPYVLSQYINYTEQR